MSGEREWFECRMRRSLESDSIRVTPGDAGIVVEILDAAGTAERGRVTLTHDLCQQLIDSLTNAKAMTIDTRCHE